MNQDDAIFPIRHIAEVTGVLSVTLRAWERRYGLLKPTRTIKGHRLYSEADITRVKEVLSLLNQGLAISQVRQVLDHQTVLRPTAQPASDGVAGLQNQLHTTLMNLDALAASRFIYDTGKNYPVAMVVERLVRPIQHRLSQTSDAIHQAAGSTLKLAMHMAMVRRLSHVHAKPHSAQILFAGLANEDMCLSYDLALVLAIEAGLPVAAIGHLVPLPALIDVAAAQHSQAIVLWADAEPKVGWENEMRAMAMQSGLRLSMGGELASRHQSFLQSIGVGRLISNMEQNIQAIKEQ